LKIFLAAEIGSNWEGSVSKAKKIIFECKKSGADAVKFQMWRADDLYPGHSLYKIIKKSELSFKQAKVLKDYSDSIGIEFFCSVFYPEAVDFLENIGISRYKIASRTCILKDPLSVETLTAVNQTKKPTFVSMGMGGNKFFIKKSLSKINPDFCYCISEYPLDIKKINWKNSAKFTGFSDHTLGITAPILYSSIMNQKKIKSIFIEKHVKLLNSKSLDASTSINTTQLSIMNSSLREIEKIKL
jgi:N,N'-diacetyllegionaminate synthase